jgi:hypothetical protein
MIANMPVHLLRQRPDLDLTVVIDGAPERWRLVDAQFNAEGLGVVSHRLIDLRCTANMRPRPYASAGIFDSRTAAPQRFESSMN